MKEFQDFEFQDFKFQVHKLPKVRFSFLSLGVDAFSLLFFLPHIVTLKILLAKCLL